MADFFNHLLFYGAALASVAATVAVLLSSNPIYAILNLVLSFFGISIIFFSLGAAFLAALEIIVYAGAIMVLFLFVIMMLNMGTSAGPPEADLRPPTKNALWIPVALAGTLMVLTLVAILASHDSSIGASAPWRLSEKSLGQALYTRHYLGVELVSLILTIGMVGGMHLGRGAALAPPSSPLVDRRLSKQGPLTGPDAPPAAELEPLAPVDDSYLATAAEAYPAAASKAH